jgi:hypothetical protein
MAEQLLDDALTRSCEEFSRTLAELTKHELRNARRKWGEGEWTDLLAKLEASSQRVLHAMAVLLSYDFPIGNTLLLLLGEQAPKPGAPFSKAFQLLLECTTDPQTLTTAYQQAVRRPESILLCELMNLMKPKLAFQVWRRVQQAAQSASADSSR